MKFGINELNTNKVLNSQLELKYGKILIKNYPYLIFFKNNYLFSLELLSKIFPKEISNQYDKISLNKIDSYISYDYKLNMNVFLHAIDSKTKETLKNQLITVNSQVNEDLNNINDINQYKILDLIEDEHYILMKDSLKVYNLYVCFLNGKYILLSSVNKLHNYFNEVEAKYLLNEL